MSQVVHLSRGEKIRVAVNFNHAQHLKIAVYNLLGREMAILTDGETAGNQLYQWDGQGAGSGLYLVAVEREAGREVRKAVLVK